MSNRHYLYPAHHAVKCNLPSVFVVRDDKGYWLGNDIPSRKEGEDGVIQISEIDPSSYRSLVLLSKKNAKKYNENDKSSSSGSQSNTD